ncbi:hypothetical protein HDU97_007857 [Phlyctochytrium planicorne]|nr:hypothetical protein HDU97_007857 [Phlyctochytrium planicorne]
MPVSSEIAASEGTSTAVARGRPDNVNPSSKSNRRRSVSLCSDASVDQFGRVKRRRKSESGSESDSDSGSERHRNRRHRSRSRSYERNWRTGKGSLKLRDRSRSLSSDGRNGDTFKKQCVHVTDLPPGTTHDLLKDHFSEAGRVTHVKLYLHKPSRYGFVEFSSSEGAARAIKDLDGVPLRGYTLRVSRARIPEPGRQGSKSWQDLDSSRTPFADRHSQRSIGGDFDDLLSEYTAVVFDKKGKDTHTGKDDAVSSRGNRDEDRNQRAAPAKSVDGDRGKNDEDDVEEGEL